jgi:UDP-N-acetylglucosamine 2-epimerase (non-hydrolysing)
VIRRRRSWVCPSTSSGQAQGRPRLTLRKNTERPVTVTQGTNVIVGSDPERSVFKALGALDNESEEERVPELWDGRAAERILAVLMGVTVNQGKPADTGQNV